MTQVIRVAVLMADYPRERSLKLYGDYGRIFAQLLYKAHEALKSSGESIDIELKCTSWDVCQHESYPNLEDIDIAIITGSRANAFDNTPWITKLVEFCQKVIYEQDRVKLIGVCFGHQIIGRSIGLPVERNPNGWEFSVSTINLDILGKEGIAEGMKDQLKLHQSHQDMINCEPSDLPRNVYNLGSSDVCKIQGLYRRGKFLSSQAHPEFNEDIMGELLEIRTEAGLFTEAQFKDGMERRKLEHDGILVGKAFLRFAVKG